MTKDIGKHYLLRQLHHVNAKMLPAIIENKKQKAQFRSLKTDLLKREHL